jgi:hypothetical protein
LNHAQAIRDFLAADPRLAEANFTAAPPTLRDWLPAIVVEQSLSAQVRVRVFAHEYDQSKRLVRLIEKVLGAFSLLTLETDWYTFDARRGRRPWDAQRYSYEITQDYDVVQAADSGQQTVLNPS